MLKKLLSTPKNLVMGVLNITPDSLSGDGLMSDKSPVERALQQAKTFTEMGADILDIGGESTRPGASPVSLEEEMNRVLPVIDCLLQYLSIPLSIDTTKATVAREAVKRGACLINDVSGLTKDPAMTDVALETGAYVVITHSKANESTEQTELGGRYLKGDYKDVVKEVSKELENLVLHATRRGVKKDKIIIDPGIGFGKTVEENLELLANLEAFTKLGYPLLLGVSRKSVIGYTTKAPPEKRLGGSIAANTLGILKGAKIVRVHDVEETVQAARLMEGIERYLKC